MQRCGREAAAIVLQRAKVRQGAAVFGSREAAGVLLRGGFLRAETGTVEAAERLFSGCCGERGGEQRCKK